MANNNGKNNKEADKGIELETIVVDEATNLLDEENSNEDNLIDEENSNVFTNPDFKPEEKNEIPPHFVEPPKPQKEASFGVKNGRMYKKIDEYHAVYTDTGETFRLK